MEVIGKTSNIEEPLDGIFSDEALKSSPIRNYFKGKTILLTGATGFLGQLLLEKLLCCDAEHIYLLARAKKDKSAAERLREMFAEVHFAKMKKFRPDYLQHVSIIEGDMSALELGIKSADREIIENTVQIILHSAANVRFNERLYDLIMANLRGTRELLQLAETCKMLQVFNYISTAYSNCPHGRVIKENFYEAAIDPNKIIEFAEICSNRTHELENLEILTERLIGIWPNTYSFSKSLSEAIVQRFAGKFPICVVRPSIVISTYQEPVPGWCNNIFGLNGMLTALGSGIVRITLANSDSNINVVCADYTINAILSATWATDVDEQSRRKCIANETNASTTNSNKNQPKIYAIVSSSETLTYRYIQDTMVPQFHKYPVKNGLWVLCSNSTTSILLFKYLSLYYHLLPSLIFDLVFKLIGQKMRILPITRKIQIFLYALSYFMNNQWKFDNSNMCALADRLHPIDKKLFFCDTRQFDFGKWIFTYMQGMKVYILKESLDVLQTARKKYLYLRIGHFFVRIAFYLSQLATLYFIAKGFGLIGHMRDSIILAKEFIEQPNNVMLM